MDISLMDKLHLMVKLKERIYTLSRDITKQGERKQLEKLLDRLQSDTHLKHI
jgi:hypothetical protein